MGAGAGFRVPGDGGSRLRGDGFGYDRWVRTVTEAEFKEHCLEFIAEVGEGDVAIVRDGEVLALLTAGEPTREILLARLRMKYQTIIVDPEDNLFSTGRTWDAHQS